MTTRQPESAIVGMISKHLRRRGWLVHKNHGGPMVAPGWPDLICIKAGRVVFLEVKRPGERPTKIQEHVLGQLAGQQVPASVVYSVEDAIKFCESGFRS